jgi:hypothetical protein
MSFAGQTYRIVGASEGPGRALAQALDQAADLVLAAMQSGRFPPVFQPRSLGFSASGASCRVVFSIGSFAERSPCDRLTGPIEKPACVASRKPIHHAQQVSGGLLGRDRIMIAVVPGELGGDRTRMQGYAYRLPVAARHFDGGSVDQLVQSSL